MSKRRKTRSRIAQMILYSSIPCQNVGPIHHVLKSFDIAKIERFLTMVLKGQNVAFEKSRVTHATSFTFFGAKAVDSFQPKIRHHQCFVPRKLRFYICLLKRHESGINLLTNRDVVWKNQATCPRPKAEDR